ncbi:hypothetical protein [Dactylosporangium sp. NPDC048998]|uniref:hypothetical protein n=1 Tax=Dactylosporangium sp. NPDC048998 TaxID=3363976 RepID=UPI0037243E42
MPQLDTGVLAHPERLRALRRARLLLSSSSAPVSRDANLVVWVVAIKAVSSSAAPVRTAG